MRARARAVSARLAQLLPGWPRVFLLRNRRNLCSCATPAARLARSNLSGNTEGYDARVRRRAHKSHATRPASPPASTRGNA